MDCATTVLLIVVVPLCWMATERALRDSEAGAVATIAFWLIVGIVSVASARAIYETWR